MKLPVPLLYQAVSFCPTGAQWYASTYKFFLRERWKELTVHDYGAMIFLAY